MLNKDICKKCVGKHYPKVRDIVDSWENPRILSPCPFGGWIHPFLSAPKWCPFVLEHLMELQKR